MFKKIVNFFRKINAEDVVLWVTNDCEPFEWTFESRKRFETFIKFWKQNGPFHILVSGGIPNKAGKTIADAIAKKMVEYFYDIEQYFLPFENTSSDSAEAVIETTEIFLEYKKQNKNSRLFIVSNFWHSIRIWIMFFYQGIAIRRIVSPTSGGLAFRFKRFINEIVLIAITIVDPCYKLFFFEKERQIRKKKARENIID